MKLPKISKSFVRFIAIRAIMALLLFMTLAAWAMSSALGSSNDEDFILTSMWCGTSESIGATPYCQPDPNRPGFMIVPGLVTAPDLCLHISVSGHRGSAACQEGVRNEVFLTDHYNKGGYPKTYPDVMRNFVSADVEKSVVQMRLFNSLLAALILILAFSINLRPFNDAHLTWMIVIIPGAAHFIGSVHNSSWTLTGTTCFVFAFMSVLNNRNVPKLWIPALLVALFAVWLTISSRPEGKYALIFLAMVLLISEFPPKGLKLSKKSLLIAGATLAIATFVYQRTNYWGQVNIFNDQRIMPEKEFPHTANDLLLNNFLQLPDLFLSYFGSLGIGWSSVRMGSMVWLFSFQSTLLLIVFAIRKSHKPHQIIFASAFLFICFVILYLNQTGLFEIINEIDPRYFLPTFIGLIIIAANNKKDRYPNSLVVSVAVMSTISNSLAVRYVIRRHVTGQDVFSTKSLNRGREWWWQFGPKPETVWLTGTLALAALWAILIYERNNEEIETQQSSTPELAN